MLKRPRHEGDYADRGLDCQEALESEVLSLIDRAMSSGWTEAEALAAKLAAGPTLGLGLTKRLIQEAATNDLDTHLDRERDCQREAGRSDDYAEGVTAFLEKRPASFRGK